jgi:membrane peptidoglycan carboxypeptidase
VLLESGADAGEQVIRPEVAADTTFALKGVAQYSRRALDGGREVASKTGTQGLNASENSDAWMVGYTPSLSAAVWVGNDNPNVPIENAQGQIVYGAGLPGAVWQQFMDTALAGTPEEDLPDRAVIRGDTGEGVPEPEPEPAPRTESAPTSSAPAPRPEPEPEPEPVEQEEPEQRPEETTPEETTPEETTPEETTPGETTPGEGEGEGTEDTQQGVPAPPAAPEAGGWAPETQAQPAA